MAIFWVVPVESPDVWHGEEQQCPVSDAVGDCVAGHPKKVDVCAHPSIHPDDRIDVFSGYHGLYQPRQNILLTSTSCDTHQSNTNQVIIPLQSHLGHPGPTQQPQQHCHHGQPHTWMNMPHIDRHVWIPRDPTRVEAVKSILPEKQHLWYTQGGQALNKTGRRSDISSK
jgi:uncharacterized Fe-S cluster protein YjdI